MSRIDKFEDLKSWQEARLLCQSIYVHLLSNEEIRDFPLKNQINSSSGSIMDNIAEGFGRSGNKEFRQFLTIAKGSCTEVKSQLYRSLDRNYINPDVHQNLSQSCDNIGKLIMGLIKYLNSSDLKGGKFKNESNTQKTSN